MTKTAGEIKTEIEEYAEEILERELESRDERAFYCIAFSLLFIDEPQLVHVYSTELITGHVLVCYGVKDHTLYVADPNYPEKEDATIDFHSFGSRLGPYVSAKNLEEIEKGKYTTYDQVYYSGKTCFFDLSKIRELWTEYKSGEIEERFPEYDIWVIELDDHGNETDRYILDLINGLETDRKYLDFEMDASFGGEIEIYRYVDISSTVYDNQATADSYITLNEGNNLVGFYVKGEKNGELWWAGFDWVNIFLEETEVGAASFSESDCECNVDIDTVGGTVKEKDVLQESHKQQEAELQCSYEKLHDGSIISQVGFGIEYYPNAEDAKKYFDWDVESREMGDTKRRESARDIVDDVLTEDGYYFIAEGPFCGAMDPWPGECYYANRMFVYRDHYLLGVGGWGHIPEDLDWSFLDVIDGLEEHAKSIVDRQ